MPRTYLLAVGKYFVKTAVEYTIHGLLVTARINGMLVETIV
jgi:hypothetical protein